MMINKRFTSIFISLILMGSVLLLGTLPTFALSDADFTVVTITQEDLINMFNNGDLTFTFSVSNTGDPLSIAEYNMSSHSSSVTTIGSSSLTSVSYSESRFTAISTYNNGVMFYSPYVWNQRTGGNNSLTYSVDISMPFEYAINDTINSRYFVSGYLPDGSGSVNLTLMNGSNTVTSGSYTFNNSTANFSVFWSALNYTDQYYHIYNWLPGSGTSYDATSTGIKTHYIDSSVTLNSNYTVGTNLSFSMSVDMYRTEDMTDVAYRYYNPLMFILDEFDVLVPKQYEDVVVEYLDAIAGPPSAENQQIINDLKDRFDTTSGELEQAASDVHVDMPDDPPALEDLPEEVSEGMTEAATNVMAPLVGIGIVNILISTTFIFAFLKLLLYGSGPS